MDAGKGDAGMEQIRIKVATNVLAERANSAEQKINDVRTRFERMSQIVQNSRNYWEGDANNAHRREFQEYWDDIEEALARFMENVTDLRKIANIYQEAENETENLSQNLPWDVIV